ncbi:hypothetical protein CR161_05580 [Prosthecochloris sp. ZM]|nr:hypothetical protein CR161_05580 [Prosthecochloris sp. ZM]
MFTIAEQIAYFIRKQKKTAQGKHFWRAVYLRGTSINCCERAEDKADGAQKPESRQVGMRISSTDQRPIRVAQQINRGALRSSSRTPTWCKMIVRSDPKGFPL